MTISKIVVPKYRLSVFQRKTDLDGHLPMGHLAVFDVAARFHHFEPVNVAQGFGRFGDGGTDCVLDGLGRGAGEFDVLVDVVAQNILLKKAPAAKPAVTAGELSAFSGVDGKSPARNDALRGAGTAGKSLQ